MDSKISIIVPVFNAEKNIVKLLKSLENQTNKSFEVLFIDDGSTDESSKIINDFIERCNNKEQYKYYKINNSGVSVARNLGLKNATGDFIYFIDSDDWLNTNFIENAIKDCNNCDIVIYAYNNIFNEEIKLCEYGKDYECLDKKIFFEEMSNHYLFNSVCNKVFKRDIIDKIKFDTRLKLAEDMKFIFENFIKAKKVKYINKAYYNYNISLNGLGFSKKEGSFKQRDIVYQYILEYYKELGANKNYVFKMYLKAIMVEIMAIYQENYRVDEKIEQLKKEVLERTYISFDEMNVLNKIFYILMMRSNKTFLKNLSNIIIKVDKINKKRKFGIKE